jgi:hypothetical protein
MTTPVKVYQNVSYASLLSFAEKNPNRRRILEPIEIRPCTQESSLDSLSLPGYSSINMNPAGILSVIAYLSDPVYYPLSPMNTRIQQLNELSTELQQATEGLKQTSLLRKRKRIHDLIGTASHQGRLEEKDYLDLYQGLSFMRDVHFVLLKETIQDTIQDGTIHDTSFKGEILFSSDPTRWSNPIWIADYRGRWIAHAAESGEPTHQLLPTWLTSMEQQGWVIQWPEIDGTKVELVERLSILPGWKEEDRKKTKDVLAVRLGRASTLQRFIQWNSTGV